MLRLQYCLLWASSDKRPHRFKGIEHATLADDMQPTGIEEHLTETCEVWKGAEIVEDTEENYTGFRGVCGVGRWCRLDLRKDLQAKVK